VTGKQRPSLAQIWSRLRGGSLEPGRAAASVAVGVFVGCLPIYGVQFLVVFAICVPLRLDAALSYLAAHVSNPLTLPFVLAAEMETGALLLTGHHASFGLAAAKRLGVMALGTQIVVGAVTLGAVLALLAAVITWFLVQSIRDLAQHTFTAARARTLTRYHDAPPSVRGYLSSKLRTDPALRSIAALPGSFGRVVDAGCGFGQIGLALLELGRANNVTGFDADRGRIDVARGAGGTDAHFEPAALADAEFPEADTVLFVDSLHYLPIAVQDTVLERAARNLAPGGRIIVRDVDAGTSIRSAMTETAERFAALFRRRPADFGFRSTVDLVAVLGRLGLIASKEEHTDWSLTNNVLTVATKPADNGEDASKSVENQ
jgi:uncharacterized protein (DUF2062 family)/SAM-dependent methyltransferase